MTRIADYDLHRSYALTCTNARCAPVKRGTEVEIDGEIEKYRDMNIERYKYTEIELYKDTT